MCIRYCESSAAVKPAKPVLEPHLQRDRFPLPPFPAAVHLRTGPAVLDSRRG